MPADFLVFALGAGLAVIGAVGIFDPELGFRLENPFQTREVELTQHGVDMQVIGGVACILIGWLIVPGLLSRIYWLLFGIVTAVPFVYSYRNEIRRS